MRPLRKDAFLVASGLAASLAAPASAAEPPGLKDLMPKGMVIGVALSQRQSDGKDPVATRIVTRNFSSATPENVLKWEAVHPEPGRYNFEPADRFLAFAEKRGLRPIGHVLVWHSQTPAWVFAGKDGEPLDRATALARMREHIFTVVGRYKGRIKGWDVVNEAFDDGPEGTLRKSKWREAIGDDYIAKAFEFAHRADPEAELYYNDYSLQNPAKRAAALRLLKQLRQWGLRIDGVGEQGHWLIDDPSLSAIEATITDIAAAGFKVLITELDIDVLPRDPAMYGADLEKKAEFKAETNLYPAGLPKEKQDELARRYADIFALFLKHREMIPRVTFWGVTDAQSWLSHFPVPGRVNHPLLFDRQGKPKPAFDAVLETLKKK
jgi:endo-1,4-beta-xylanase